MLELDPTRGSETGKTRPCVVLQDDSLGRLDVRVVVPITDYKAHFAGYLWMTPLTPTGANGLSKPSAADALQIHTVSLVRFGTRLGRLTAETVDEVADSIAICVRAPK